LFRKCSQKIFGRIAFSVRRLAHQQTIGSLITQVENPFKVDLIRMKSLGFKILPRFLFQLCEAVTDGGKIGI
jgi:hypothetical protein